MTNEFSPRFITYEQGGVGWVARRHAPLVLDDIISDERVLNRAWSERWGLRTFAGYPVLAGEELLAVMALNHSEPLRFGKDKQDLVDLFLAQAAIAIQNARLYREAQRRRDVAEVLARLARELTSTLEAEPIAKLLAKGAAELVNARAAGVFLLEPEDGALRALATYGADADIMRELVFKAGERARQPGAAAGDAGPARAGREDVGARPARVRRRARAEQSAQRDRRLRPAPARPRGADGRVAADRADGGPGRPDGEDRPELAAVRPLASGRAHHRQPERCHGADPRTAHQSAPDLGDRRREEVQPRSAAGPGRSAPARAGGPDPHAERRAGHAGRQERRAPALGLGRRARRALWGRGGGL